MHFRSSGRTTTDGGTSFGGMMHVRDCCQVSCHDFSAVPELYESYCALPAHAPIGESKCDTSYYYRIPLWRTIFLQVVCSRTIYIIRERIISMVQQCPNIVVSLVVRAGVIKRVSCKTVSFHAIPRDVSIRHQWLVSIKKPITISEHTRICSLHFVGGMKSASSPIPTLFPWSTPAAVRATPRQRSPPPTPQPKHPKLEEQLYEALDEAQMEIDARDKRIEELESEVVSMRVEMFGLQQLACSDSDIMFYTGLPT